MTIRSIFSLGLLLLLSVSLLAQEKTLQKEKSQPVVASKPVKKHLLQYRFRAGESLLYQSRFEMTMTTVKGSSSEKVVSKTKMKKHFKVVSVEKDQSIILEPILDHVVMSVKFNETEPITYNSSSQKAPPRKFKHVVESIGIAMVHLKINSQGKLLDVILQKLKKKRPVITKTKGDRTNQMLQKSFLVKFPDKPVQIGESWKEILQSTVSIKGIRLQMPVRLKRSYQLKSVENNIATISVKTSLLTVINDSHQRAQLIQRTPRGTILFDIKKGILISRKMKVHKKVFGIAGGNSYMEASSQFEETFVEKKKAN
ncbi:hypothetical protein MNBD_PLANCTO02-2619 [hydrothermal vent metagenome]|uniref:Uncharacterized protein n=1 Tax=hydrothermal vent metagenome TaxID=652676 RepID=A0A3B1E8B2_9ZZZZ